MLTKSNEPIASNFLMESKRLELLDKACKRAYGVIFSIGELQHLDQTIIKAIHKLKS